MKMTEQWTHEAKWQVWFYAGAAHILQAAGLIEDYLEQPQEDDTVLEFVGKFEEDIQGLSDFTTPQGAAAAFKDWAAKQAPAIEQGEKRTLSMKISKTYGGVVLELGLSSQFTIRKETDLFRAFDMLAADLKAQFEAQERKTVSTMKPPQQQAAAAGAASGITNRFFGDTIILEMKDGKPYYKIYGGQFSKFGVRVWPETLRAAGVDPDAVLTTGTPLGRDCVAEVVNGRVKKVLEIK
jgi:hypothetical protein